MWQHVFFCRGGYINDVVVTSDSRYFVTSEGGFVSVWNLKNAIVLSRAAQTDVFQLLELVEVSDSNHEGSNQGGAYFVAAISRQTCNKTSNTIYRFALVQ